LLRGETVLAHRTFSEIVNYIKSKCRRPRIMKLAVPKLKIIKMALPKLAITCVIMVAFLSIIEAQGGGEDTGNTNQTANTNKDTENENGGGKNPPSEETGKGGGKTNNKDGKKENDDGKSNGKTTTPGNGASGISCSMLLIASTTMIALFASSCADLK